jgi:dTDP-4-dehydrorhamnose 3,5-epimerase-like enzyme
MHYPLVAPNATTEGHVYLIDFAIKGDERGSLIALEGLDDTAFTTSQPAPFNQLPFAIKRVYYIFNNAPDVVRGKHAHKDLQQVLVAVSGSCQLLTDTGKTRKTTLLDSPAKGLYMNSGVWREMSAFSPDCVLMVLASQHFTPDDYIWDYQTFLTMYG